MILDARIYIFILYIAPMFFRRLFIRFRNSSSYISFPVITPTILAAGLVSISGAYKKVIPSVPKLPPQEKEKPVLLFDFKNFLIKENFSLLHPFRVFSKRYCCGPFLLGALNHYELISLSNSNPVASSRFFEHIDPYGCVTYRVNVLNKKEFSAEHLNRPLSNLVVISTRQNEFSNDFSSNTLQIPAWNGQKDTKLLDLLSFLEALALQTSTGNRNGRKDVRKSIGTYKGKDFFSTFKGLQQKLFRSKDIFGSRNFNKHSEEAKQDKIEKYRKAKIAMDSSGFVKGHKFKCFSMIAKHLFF